MLGVTYGRGNTVDEILSILSAPPRPTAPAQRHHLLHGEQRHPQQRSRRCVLRRRGGRDQQARRPRRRASRAPSRKAQPDVDGPDGRRQAVRLAAIRQHDSAGCHLRAFHQLRRRHVADGVSKLRSANSCATAPPAQAARSKNRRHSGQVPAALAAIALRPRLSLGGGVLSIGCRPVSTVDRRRSACANRGPTFPLSPSKESSRTRNCAARCPLRPPAQLRRARRFDMIDLFLDGKLIARIGRRTSPSISTPRKLPMDTTRLRFVGVDSGPIETQGRIIVPVHGQQSRRQAGAEDRRRRRPSATAAKFACPCDNRGPRPSRFGRTVGSWPAYRAKRAKWKLRRRHLVAVPPRCKHSAKASTGRSAPVQIAVK